MRQIIIWFTSPPCILLCTFCHHPCAFLEYQMLLTLDHFFQYLKNPSRKNTWVFSVFEKVLHGVFGSGFSNTPSCRGVYHIVHHTQIDITLVTSREINSYFYRNIILLKENKIFRYITLYTPRLKKHALK